MLNTREIEILMEGGFKEEIRTEIRPIEDPIMEYK